MDYKIILEAIKEYERTNIDLIGIKVSGILETWKATDVAAITGISAERIRNMKKRKIKPLFDEYIKIICIGKNEAENRHGKYRKGKEAYMKEYYENITKEKRRKEVQNG